MIRSFYIRCAYLHFRFITTFLFYHYEVNNGAFSLLSASSSPLWLIRLYSLSLNVFMTLFLHKKVGGGGISLWVDLPPV